MEKNIKIENPAEPLIFERSSAGRVGVEPPSFDVPDIDDASLPEGLLRSDIEGFPEIGEPETVRHFTRLSQLNFGVDTGFYPLGSCTMKYNPKINETTAAIPGFAGLHPYQDESLSQGALELISELEEYLVEITGMDAVTLQPAAGAQGELCGMLMIADYFKGKGENRKKVLIPDTAHGTNPATCHLAGFEVVRVQTGPEGVITPGCIEGLMDDGVAALMLTNPNTLGLFEENIKEIADIIHAKGGIVYCDGANLNAVMGLMKLGDMGIDVVQLNLHKTFSTPHGGGGPGSGPLAVKKILEPYLPVPRVVKEGDTYSLDYNKEKSIGRLKAFYGHFSVMVRAYTYIRRMGPEGLRSVSELAILNANYIKERLREDFHLPYDRTCMHECVLSDKFQNEHDVTTLDMAKRLIDYGYHPPTIYFPLIVHGAMMIEPTETEDLLTIDSFIDAMKSIAKEARETPQLVKGAPYSTKTSRVDETRAARTPVLRWRAQ
ncbi:Glycine dehydrogenase [decarboxylating] (glycine cleavage system P2 protein) [hydrothermal vent metagenome]|uniref:glycine dehydrogenase (aminomethyl-transferring) n=1 Tax=hydrothermal vent metagenome TaxID=652676 RepID=A0A3B0QTV1_9ZZZZ